LIKRNTTLIRNDVYDTVAIARVELGLGSAAWISFEHVVVKPDVLDSRNPLVFSKA
jgi:hypothetical protein